jgi:hypothetical protein
MNIKPYIGMKFLHKRVLDGNYLPAKYIVTKIAEGIVYYKQPSERKAMQSCYVGQFDKYAGEEWK